ncbi:MAG: hypothetical protein ACREMB_20475 [Candidatus Rokuibacteriota bacterium]
MTRPNGLRQKLATDRTCVAPIIQEFWSPEVNFGALVRRSCEEYLAAFRGERDRGR